MQKRTTVFLSERQISLLKEEADALEMTMAELLRRIVDEHYRNGKK